MCLKRLNPSSRFLVLSLFLLLLLFSAEKARAQITPIPEEERGDLIEELVQNSERLEKLVNELQMNNSSLAIRLMLAGESLEIMKSYSMRQSELLNETRKSHENYLAAVDTQVSRDRAEVWFWRIVGFIGLLYGAYQTAK